jgi:amidohydrolase
MVREFLEATGPARTVTGIAGHGIAALYAGESPGLRIMVRCELDAVAMQDGTGVFHGCGHDGHMAVAAALGADLGKNPPKNGSVLLLFQPAEETGAGAAAVLEDPKFTAVLPDLAIGFHNLPGFPLGSVAVRNGVFASGSAGITVRLTGTSSHAGEPHRGRSPAGAMIKIMEALPAVPQNGRPSMAKAVVTVIHARLGSRAFGVSPGDAVVMATVRSPDGEVLDGLLEECARKAEDIARAEGIRAEHSIEEVFPPVVNNRGLSDLVRWSAESLGMELIELREPFPWSEDFGRFTGAMLGVMFGLGAGEDTAPLHHPDYRFPDALIEPGARLLRKVLDSAAGRLP